jgi:hypothetical protein
VSVQCCVFGVVWCGVVWCCVLCANESTSAEQGSFSAADENIIPSVNKDSLLCSLQYGYS